MSSKYNALFLTPLLFLCSAYARNSHPGQSSVSTDPTKIDQLPPAYVPTGRQMYRDYCAACHGSNGKGRGPVEPSLSKRAPNLTTLAKRHGGIFPRDYVTTVLQFGPGFSAHGSPDMPVWGPIFRYLENHNEAAVRHRIKNVCDFLESIQER